MNNGNVVDWIFSTIDKPYNNEPLLNVGVDEDGNRAFSIALDGRVLVSGVEGSDLQAQRRVKATGTYYFGLLQSGTVQFIGSAGEVTDMVSGQKYPTGNNTSLVLPVGYYNFTNTSGNTDISYTLGMRNLSFNFYNQKGELLATIAPEGVKKLITAGYMQYSTLNRGTIPFISTYTYDVQGRLIKSTLPDQGTTEFVYRKDGSVRFSQNSKQRIDGRYSYTNYDKLGRSVESGEHLPNASGIQFQSDVNVASPMLNILENTDVNGGLTTGTKYDVVRFKYGEVDSRHGHTNYSQDSYYLRGALSVSEKYSSIVNNTVNEQNLISRSWFNYNSEGQLDWHIQYLNGLGYKTTDYSYDEFGRVIKSVYQRYVPTEFMAYYNEYDRDGRLLAQYTNTVDNPSTKLLHAKYYYYLHGPLKRVELGDKLQGIDYTYTVDGKLKSVNSANPEQDPGADGTSSGFAKDVFGYSMEYYPNDYSRISNNIGSIQAGSTSPNYTGIVNGIAWYTQRTAASGGARTAIMNSYEYDRDYNLKSNNWGVPNFTNRSFTATSNVWQEKGLTYDMRGNIKTLQRTNGTGSTIANYTYNYSANSNQLTSVGGYASNTFDGLGRPLQTVQWQGSPTKKDIVQHIEYDGFGRESKKYLPYAEQSSNNGSYKSGAKSNQIGFYQVGEGWDPYVVRTSKPYAETVFENSPLNRVLQQGAPGEVWQPATTRGTTGNTLVTDYGTNTAIGTEAVRLWTVAGSTTSSTANYLAGKLYKTTIKDENWRSGNGGTVDEYKDFEGRVVLKRIWESETKKLETYYVYDDFGDLRYVIPPGLELQLKSGDFFTLLIFLFSLAFLPFGLVFYVQ